MGAARTAVSFRSGDLRNIALLGRGGSGKTTLAEALLHRGGMIPRMGSVEAHDTVADFEPEARGHKLSTSSTLLYLSWHGRELNVIDTPGHPDFVGHALAAMPAVETAVVVVDAVAGLDLSTRRLFHAAGELGLARVIVINKIDQNLAGLPALVAQLKAELGPSIHCINLPRAGGTDVIDCFDHAAGQADFGDVAEVHKEMLESTVEIDDAAMERYLAGDELDLEALRRCFVTAMNAGHVVPVLFTAGKDAVGVDDLMHVLVEESPSPVAARPHRVRKGDEIIEVACDADAPLVAHVFKVTTDPYAGKLAMLRILSGKLDGNTLFVCGSNGDRKPRKCGHVLKVEGREHPELDAVAYAGDLVAVAKIDELHMDQIVHAPGLPDDLTACRPAYPVPMISLALLPLNKNDDVKLGAALNRLTEEDPTLRAGQDALRQFVVSGLGDLHLRVTLEKLKNRFNVDVSSRPPSIAYRETVAARAEGHFRLRKQTGGAGQFAEVYLRVEPLRRGEGFQFASEVFGGAIPSQYISSVEKGVTDALERGALAGFPIQDVRVVVYDGKSHPVDSKDIAFRTAGKMAFRDALTRARPVLLEPIVSLDVTVGEAHLGTVTADMKTLRGRVMGVDTTPAGQSVVHVQAPLAELSTYGAQLRGATGGEGSFVMELSHYDIVPTAVQQKLVASYKPKEEAE
jgi:elongation factor G